MGRFSFVLLVGAVSAFTLLAACVGDDPATSDGATDASLPDSSAQPDSGGTDSGGTDSGGTDSGASMEAGQTCVDGGLMVFAPGPSGLGAFCGAGANPDPDAGHQGRYCAIGDHCCIPPGAAHACSNNCTGGGGDFECAGAADCQLDGGSLVCCSEATAVLDETTCRYPIFTTIHHGTCQQACAMGTRQLCHTDMECTGGATQCVGAGTPYAGFTIAVCQ